MAARVLPASRCCRGFIADRMRASFALVPSQLRHQVFQLVHLAHRRLDPDGRSRPELVHRQGVDECSSLGARAVSAGRGAKAIVLSELRPAGFHAGTGTTGAFDLNVLLVFLSSRWESNGRAV